MEKEEEDNGQEKLVEDELAFMREAAAFVNNIQNLAEGFKVPVRVVIIADPKRNRIRLLGIEDEEYFRTGKIGKLDNDYDNSYGADELVKSKKEALKITALSKAPDYVG